MITKRELSGRRELKNIASVFDTVKGQRDKLLEMAEWYWLSGEAEQISDWLQIKKYQHGLAVGILRAGAAQNEAKETVICAWNNFERLSEEIRKEMGGE